MTAAELHRDDKIEVNRPCWICGSTEAPRSLYTLEFPDQGYPGEFRLHRCKECGVVFNSPRLTESALAKLYEKNYYLFLERPADAVHRISSLFSATLRELIERNGIEPRDALEIGSAKGYLLALLREHGWTVRGVELSQHASAFASCELGLSIFNGTIEAYAANAERPDFDLVYSTDVIEHVPDPRTFVQALGKVVKPGGYLLLGTPNGSADGIDINGPMWGGFNPFHIWFFTRSCLARLLEQSGFEVIESYTYGNLEPSRRQSPSHIKAKVRRRLPPKVIELLRAVKYRSQDWQNGRRRSIRELIADAAEEVMRQPPFRDTKDGTKKLRAACRGENLVVMARRRT
ncbi:MAG: class I SAM-dependent methyltransferase [Polyangiaceae bacterium]